MGPWTTVMIFDFSLWLRALSLAASFAMHTVNEPNLVMPETVTMYVVPVVPIGVTITLFAPVVPPRVTPAAEKPVTGSEKTTVNWIVVALVWGAAVMVTV